MNKKIAIGIILLVIVLGLAWAFIESTKPLLGEAALQDGRDHKPEGSKIDYKYNPPTSGDHYSSWITKGFYDEPRADGNLVHSQEHGYIIIWYNCDQKLGFNFINTAFAQQESASPSASMDASGTTAMTAGEEGKPSVKLQDLPASFRDGSCNNLKNQLRQIYNSDSHKLIVVPRVGTDHPIILTAWGRMLKLSSVDKNKIQEFMASFRDRGPETTDEP